MTLIVRSRECYQWCNHEYSSRKPPRDAFRLLSKTISIELNFQRIPGKVLKVHVQVHGGHFEISDSKTPE